jgi:hypothetical protein
MNLDDSLIFAMNVSVAAAAGTTTVIGDVIDLGSPGQGGTPNAITFPGDGEPLYLNILTGNTEIITAGAAGTLELQLRSDSTSNLATSPTIHARSRAYVTDDDAANSAELNVNGKILVVPLPVENYERFLGVVAVVGGVDITAGNIKAWIGKHPSRNLILPDGLPAGS